MLLDSNHHNFAFQDVQPMNFGVKWCKKNGVFSPKPRMSTSHFHEFSVQWFQTMPIKKKWAIGKHHLGMQKKAMKSLSISRPALSRLHAPQQVKTA